MPEFLQSFFAVEPSILCGDCYVCQPGLASLHIASDTFIGLTYYAIAIALALFRQKRRILPYAGVFMLFGVAIVFSGTTHLMEVWTHWHTVAANTSPSYIYWLSGFLKVFTILVLIYTTYQLKPIAIGLFDDIPDFLEKSGISVPHSETGEAIDRVETIEELTECKQTIEELRKTNQTLQRLIEASPLAIATIDFDGNVTMWNPAAERLFGWSESEVLGKLLPIIPAEKQEEFRAILKAESLGKKFIGVELRRQRKDGLLIDISLWTATIFDDSGVARGSIGVFVDISDKIRAEEALRESQQQLQAIMDNSPAIIFVKDIESRYTLINRRFETLFHISREEIKGKAHSDIFPREIADQLRANDLQVLAGRTPIEIEEVVPQDDGLHTYISVKFPLYDCANVPYAICAISTDITERKQAERNLLQKTSELQAIFQAFPDLYLRLEEDGTIVDCNLGQVYNSSDLYVPPEVFLGKRTQDVLPPEVGQQFQDAVEEVVRTKSLVGLEYTLPVQNELRSYETRLLPLLEKQIIAIVRNVTDRKRAEEELKKSLKDLSDIKYALDRAAIVAITDRLGKITYINDKFCQLSKYSREELIGQDHRIVNSGYHTKEFFQNLWSTIKKGEVWQGEIKNKAKDGSYYWVDTTIVPLLDERGKPNQYLAIRFDITARKQAEEEQQNLIAVIESCSDFIGIATLDEQPFYINEAGRKLVGLEKMEELKQIPISEYYLPSDLTEFRETILPTVMEQGRWQGEFRFRHFKTKAAIPVHLNLFTINDRKTGQPIALATVTRDITDRKLAEEELRRSEAKFRELATREALLNRLASQIRRSLDINTILETAVLEIRNLLQIDRCLFIWYRPDSSSSADGEKKGVWEIVQEARNFAFPSVLGRVIPIAELGPLTTKILNKQITRVDNVRNLTDPTERRFFFSVGYIALLAFPIHTTSGEIGLVSCSHSSGSRPWRDAEVELLQAVADQLAIAIDQADLYKQTRTAAVKAQEQATKLEQTLRELQQTQAQLVQSEKMSSLGQMVAGVAHEINNPVNFIYGNINPAKEYAQDLMKLLQLYQKNYPNAVKEIQEEAEAIDIDFLKEDLPKILDSMKIGADRIRKIVLSLRNFSRLDEAEMKAVDIHEGIDSALLILQNRLRSQTGVRERGKPNRREIQVIKEYGKLPLVECYPGQLNQVFMNILNNAIDALEMETENRGMGTGEVSIPNPKSQIQNPQIRIRTEVQDRERIMIRIADNGPGMTEEVQQRIFDPFFTTKPVGSGTGLGMSICYQIINKHSGQLTCNSAPGHGAEFVIEIPVRQQR